MLLWVSTKALDACGFGGVRDVCALLLHTICRSSAPELLQFPSPYPITVLDGGNVSVSGS